MAGADLSGIFLLEWGLGVPARRIVAVRDGPSGYVRLQIRLHAALGSICMRPRCDGRQAARRRPTSIRLA